MHTLMVCPKCHIDSISFVKMWLKSGCGCYRCPNCGAICRVAKSKRLAAGSFCLGIVAGGLGLLFWSWLVFGLTLAMVVMLDAIKKAQYRLYNHYPIMRM